ncbi:MAG: hypothetical protein ABSF44_15445 [Candidatus Bathyarchaeia archaeon]|jgi:hypothetical protein
MVFEKIGAAQVNKDVQALKIEIDAKTYWIGLSDLDQAVKNNRLVGVFQLTEKAIQQETAATP